jgi:signal transduction histidine kinase
MSSLLRRVLTHAPRAGAFLVVVLLASLAVAVVLAYQAITAARHGQAVAEAMRRQYAELALWEFSRQARREVDEALMHALASWAHPERATRTGTEGCNCDSAIEAEQWFEVLREGRVSSRPGTFAADVGHRLAALTTAETRDGTEGGLRISTFPGDATRLVAIRWEPHVGSSGAYVGLVAAASALAPVIRRTYERASLLPAALVRGQDPRRVVDIRVIDRQGQPVFSSRAATAAAAAETVFLPHVPLGLMAQAALTPEFIASLAPEHGGGPSTPLVIALVAVNALLVAVGLWQLARERELTRLRTDFVAGVSHELRTPLAQIRLFSETLLLERTRTPGERRRALEIIGQESQRLSQLVDNVLHFHRQRRAHRISGDTIVDLQPFAREIVDAFQPLAASSRVSVVLALNGHQSCVRADRDALRQVLLNLLDNAVKFGPAGQTVTVRVGTDGADTRVDVEDQGPGVPAADRERIFRAFERGRDTQGTGGAGIGLAVVNHVVASHGGRVSVSDVAGGGARFTIRLPALVERARESESAAS